MKIDVTEEVCISGCCCRLLLTVIW